MSLPSFLRERIAMISGGNHFVSIGSLASKLESSQKTKLLQKLTKVKILLSELEETSFFPSTTPNGQNFQIFRSAKTHKIQPRHKPKSRARKEISFSTHSRLTSSKKSN
jgi:hypothetical protein